jgi:hypothetical protein
LLKGEGTLKRIWAPIIIGLLCSLAFLGLAPKAKAQETVIFTDDFESYAVGSFPSSGGWQIVFNGMGTQYQVVTDAYYHSATKSLQLIGQDHWSSVTQKDFSSTSNIIGYEGYIMSTTLPNTGGIGFFNAPITTWGRIYAGVGIGDNNLVSWRGQSGQVYVLQPCLPYTWYKIRVVLDKNTRLYNVWINDVLVGQNLVEPNDPHEILSLEVSTGWYTGAPVYFDDITVFEVSATHPQSVGGEWSPITLQTLTPMQMLQLLAPWISLASLMAILTTSFVYIRRKRRQS